MGREQSSEMAMEAAQADWIPQQSRGMELGVNFVSTPYEAGQKSADEDPASLAQLAKDVKPILDTLESQKAAAQAAVNEAMARHVATRFPKRGE